MGPCIPSVSLDGVLIEELTSRGIYRASVDAYRRPEVPVAKSVHRHQATRSR
jgi:hypothetical protein